MTAEVLLDSTTIKTVTALPVTLTASDTGVRVGDDREIPATAPYSLEVLVTDPDAKG